MYDDAEIAEMVTTIAEDWYDSFGWHLSTQRHRDITLQAVSFEDAGVPAPAPEVTENLLGRYPGLSGAEVDRMIRRAGKIKTAALRIADDLVQAKIDHEDGNEESRDVHLDAAEALEKEVGGDCPATRAMRKEIDESSLTLGNGSLGFFFEF